MRVLLAANASYAPPKGGSTRSNIVWLDDLARRGHQCRIIAAGADGSTSGGVPIRGVADLSRNAGVLRDEVASFSPDLVLISSEDVAHTLLREAAAAAGGKIVYLAHTPQWYPFGPASWHQDARATQIVRECRGIIAIARTTAEYIKQHCGAEAAVIHPPIYGGPPWPHFGEGRAVLMINPCVVKGISIFLAMAARFPQTQFIGLAGWGTTSRDREAMAALPNIRVLESVPMIDEALAQARLLLMPSIWFEGFGLIAEEAMLRGLPVVASDAGGLVEAKHDTGYVIPVKPIERFEASFDENHMPRPIDVPQDESPWENALRVLLEDDDEYRREAARSREAAVRFVSSLDAGHFGAHLESIAATAPVPVAQVNAPSSISAAKAQLLLQRLKDRTRT
ncbi:MAG TPA: glycosyltransferase family 4 protein [Bryobacteraceae bacterium]|nr:glycosyltransferase family 4 protein [Bryobacteraceae bacterium]